MKQISSIILIFIDIIISFRYSTGTYLFQADNNVKQQLLEEMENKAVGGMMPLMPNLYAMDPNSLDVKSGLKKHFVQPVLGHNRLIINRNQIKAVQKQLTERMKQIATRQNILNNAQNLMLSSQDNVMTNQPIPLANQIALAQNQMLLEQNDLNNGPNTLTQGQNQISIGQNQVGNTQNQIYLEQNLIPNGQNQVRQSNSMVEDTNVLIGQNPINAQMGQVEIQNKANVPVPIQNEVSGQNNIPMPNTMIQAEANPPSLLDPPIDTEPKELDILTFITAILLKKELLHSGALISYEWVLTAAAALYVESYSVSDIFARVGSKDYKNGGILLGVVRIELHPYFTIGKPGYDLALIRLKSSLTGVSGIVPLNLAPDGTKLPAFHFVVASWPTHSSFSNMHSHALFDDSNVRLHHLHRASVETCGNYLSNFSHIYKYEVNTICLYATDTNDNCLKDTGAPVISHGVVWGVMSSYTWMDCETVFASLVTTSSAMRWVKQTLDTALPKISIINQKNYFAPDIDDNLVLIEQ